MQGIQSNIGPNNNSRQNSQLIKLFNLRFLDIKIGMFYTKINSKWLKDKYKTPHHRTPRREHSKIFSDINCTTVFLGRSLKAIEIKAKINKWKLVKLNTAKKTILKK